MSEKPEPDFRLSGPFTVIADGESLRWQCQGMSGEGSANGVVGEGAFYNTGVSILSNMPTVFIYGTFDIVINGVDAELIIVDNNGLCGIFSGPGSQRGLDGEYSGTYHTSQ
ncbi:hypothetical protein SISSUDRAFT_1067108 [Sistotremastrum suecicum HHB10207 ss-3]|uniref:Uncharacterized protein n=1 Tax=Sistotremastrum suecicum HHB10207 ss-3 TaxID=1314776 RepID=A0A165XI92_9AGAM|nr:hypothetical protein SISSUDRAFT_1067108 [Sistotremastrum suecicum HHB10207 ss-3]